MGRGGRGLRLLGFRGGGERLLTLSLLDLLRHSCTCFLFFVFCFLFFVFCFFFFVFFFLFFVFCFLFFVVEGGVLASSRPKQS